jgi:DNA-binding LacI/PurR family transcriptional regulator
MKSLSPRRPTIIDVALRAGVSKSMVSLVMRGVHAVSDEKRRVVLEAAAELGYRPNAVARSLVSRRTNLVGVLLSDLRNPFFTDVIDGIEAESEARGYKTIICTASRLASVERRALDTLLELRVDGVILASPMLDTGTITSTSEEVPVVLVARHLAGEPIDSVSNDDPAGAGLVVEHLAALGHRRIAHVDGACGAGADERRAGYEHAMRALGLGDQVRAVTGGYTEDGGRAGVQALLESDEPPTAIFVANDLAALGALSALSERGIRVPQDVSIVGYDNISLASVRYINLTTVDQPRPDMGRSAVSLILDRLASRRREPRHIIVPPRLVVRGTTAPPRAG